MFRLIIFIITILIMNVSWASKVKIKSEPTGAEIYIINTNGVPVKVGVTPYETDLDEFIQNYVKADSFLIEIRKPNHLIYRLMLAKTASVDMELMANLEVDPSLPKFKEHDLLVSELFDAQKLIRGRNFQDAINKLNDLEKKHPDMSVIAELKATAYYLNKEIENSLSYYRKAFAINPENVDAYKMKTYLENKLGISTDVKK